MAGGYPGSSASGMSQAQVEPLGDQVLVTLKPVATDSHLVFPLLAIEELRLLTTDEAESLISEKTRPAVEKYILDCQWSPAQKASALLEESFSDAVNT